MTIAVLFYALTALSHSVKKLKNITSGWLLLAGGQGQEQSKNELFFWSSWRGLCLDSASPKCAEQGAEPPRCRSWLDFND